MGKKKGYSKIIKIGKLFLRVNIRIFKANKWGERDVNVLSVILLRWSKRKLVSQADCTEVNTEINLVKIYQLD